MKKFLLSIVTLVYVLMSTGIAMETHYCMGRNAGVEIFATSDAKCQKCGMEQKGRCCHDEHKLYKMSSEHKNAASLFSNNFLSAPVRVPIFSFTAAVTSLPTEPVYLKSPPHIPQRDICICNCIYRV